MKPSWIVFYNRCVRNWRWWASTPVWVVVVVIPAVILLIPYALFKALQKICEGAVWLTDQSFWPIHFCNNALFAWMKKGWKPLPEEDDA